MAMSDVGDIYTWGKGVMQRDCLGHADGKTKKHPTVIDNENLVGRKASEIACGDAHMAALIL